MGKACYKHCKYKYNHSSADIRIGDLWGSAYEKNEDGVSAAIAFTEKGNDVLKQTNCSLIKHPFEVVAEGQMKEKVVKPAIFPVVSYALKTSVPLDGIIFKMILFTNRVLNKLSRMFS